MSLNRARRAPLKPARSVERSEKQLSTGQALVETALVLPILLVLTLGLFQTGLALLTDIRLLHSAQQAAAASDDCEQAESIAVRIYGSSLDRFSCNLTPEVLEVTLTDSAPIIGPWGVWSITESGRAVRSE